MNELLGNIEILEKIGEGGMGEVFKGRDLLLEREVAIKSLRSTLARSPDIVARFRTEAIALARLNHPNIATLYSLLAQGEDFYMVLEFVHGESLDRRLQRGIMPWRDALGLICQALDGLAHAHSMGIVHRDIKPANLMVASSGTLKLMDFGIARILERTRVTVLGRLIGTLEYMSPEQIRGDAIDSRSDLYSLGAVLYELLTGRVIFEKSSDYELMQAQTNELPPSPRVFMPGLSAELEAIVLRALAKQPQDRFQNAAEFRAALQSVLDKQPGTQMPDHGYVVLEPWHAPKRQAALKARLVAAWSAISVTLARQKAQLFSSALIRQYPGVVVLVLLLGLTAILIGSAGYPWPGMDSNMPVTSPTLEQENRDNVAAQKIAVLSPGSSEQTAEEHKPETMTLLEPTTPVVQEPPQAVPSTVSVISPPPASVPTPHEEDRQEMNKPTEPVAPIKTKTRGSSGKSKANKLIHAKVVIVRTPKILLGHPSGTRAKHRARRTEHPISSRQLLIDE